MTVDLVDATGVVLGRAILPGIGMSARAMHISPIATADTDGRIGRPAAGLGNSTIAAMRSGLYWGAIGAMKELIVRLAARDHPTGRTAPQLFADNGRVLDIFLTGGAAPPCRRLSTHVHSGFRIWCWAASLWRPGHERQCQINALSQYSRRPAGARSPRSLWTVRRRFASRYRFRSPSGRSLAQRAIDESHTANGRPTGEDVVVASRGLPRVEIHCHGGDAASHAILASLAAAGCEEVSGKSLSPKRRKARSAPPRVALADAATERTAADLTRPV